MPADPAAPAAQGAAARGAGRRWGDGAEVVEALRRAQADAAAGRAPRPAAPDPALAAAAVRVAIDYADAAELAEKAGKAVKAFSSGNAGDVEDAAVAGRVRRPGAGAEGRVPLHRPGLAVRQHARHAARRSSRSWPDTFAEADRVMTPLLGKPLTEFIFDGHDPESRARMEQQLLQTEITQPAVLADRPRR